MVELSPLTQKLIKDLSRSKKNPVKKQEYSKVKQCKILSCEKIKEFIDWREGHVLRRKIIEKTLRKLSKEDFSFSIDSLLTEIARFHCFNNKEIGEAKKSEIQKITDKYLYIIKTLPQTATGSKVIFIRWLLSVASCEIEEALAESEEGKIFLFYAFNSIKKIVKIDENLEEKDLLLYIAVQQALFNLDKPILSYHILKMKYANWENYVAKDIKRITPNIYKERREINRLLTHFLLKKIYRFCKLQSVSYLTINKILNNTKDVKEFLSDPENIEKEVVNYYKKRVEGTKSNLLKMIVLSAFLIFVIKSALLIFIDIPLGSGNFNNFTITFNLLLPIILVTSLATKVLSPPEKNRKKLVLQIIKILYKKDEDAQSIELLKRKKTTLHIFVELFYGFGFLFLTLFTIWVLNLIGFPILSSIIFMAFLSIIAFLEVKIREKLKNLYVIEKKENFFTIILDMFALPLIKIRNWLLLYKEKDSPVLIISKPRMKFSDYFKRLKNYLREKKESIY